MRQLATFTAIVAFALAVGFTGTAQANELVNPGAEDSTLDPWTATDTAGGVIEFTAGAHTGDWRFATDLFTGQGDITIDQDVDVTGCGVEGLPGSWEADGFVFTDSGFDTGQLVVLLSDGSGASGAVINDQDSDYVPMGPISGPIAAVATSANISMVGVDVNTDGTTFADYDDMSFTIDCVADFAKISGTKEVGTRGPKRQDPVFTFGGAVGNLESTPLVGTITINYRDIPTSCTFTPTAIVYNLDISVEIDATYVCTNSDAGTATIKMTAKDADGSCDGSDKKGRKNRGSIAVDATPDDTLDIGGGDGVSGEENCLATGNVIIDDGIV